MNDQVVAEVRESVLIVSIDRPEVRNAMTAEMAGAIARQLDRLDADPSLRVGVIHGRHGVFCAGMDLKRFNESGSRPLDPVRGGGGITWVPPKKPVIAAVEGYALGLGFEMVLACDLVVAATTARFGLPEVRHGLVAAGGGALRLPIRIPRTAAMEILLTGSMTGAQRLYELGLVNRMARSGEALIDAVNLATEIAANPIEAVAFTKELVTRSQDWSESEAFTNQEPLLNEFLAARPNAHIR